MSALIKKIYGREVFDSRGVPTLQVTLLLANDLLVSVEVPSGASKGIHEAEELRDGGRRFQGKGCLRAIEYIAQVVSPLLVGRSVLEQQGIDELMIAHDASERKVHWGGNTMIGVSLACAKAGALVKKIPLWRYLSEIFSLTPSLPKPLVNVFNGGMHAQSNIAFQEYLFAINEPFSVEGYLRKASAIIATVKGLLQKKHARFFGIGDEGGFSTLFLNNEEPLSLLQEAVGEANLSEMVMYGIDFASATFFDPLQGYTVAKDRSFSKSSWYQYVQSLVERFSLFYLEDPVYEDDFLGWKELSSLLKQQGILVGDDLTVTSEKRIREAEGGIQGVIIKPNQRGTVFETVVAARYALEKKLMLIGSHRSGETKDTSIVDVSVALGASYIKIGGLQRTERLEKYNRLIAIAEELHGVAVVLP